MQCSITTWRCPRDFVTVGQLAFCRNRWPCAFTNSHKLLTTLPGQLCTQGCSPVLHGFDAHAVEQSCAQGRIEQGWCAEPGLKHWLNFQRTQQARTLTRLRTRSHRTPRGSWVPCLLGLYRILGPQGRNRDDEPMSGGLAPALPHFPVRAQGASKVP